MRQAIDVQLVERSELRASLFDGGSWLQASDAQPPVGVTRFVAPLPIGEGERNVEANVRSAEYKARLQDSDDGDVAA